MAIYQLTISTLSLPFSRIEEIKPHPISWVWAHMTWVKCPIIPAACVSCVSVEKWFAASSVMYLTWKLYLNSLPTTTHSFEFLAWMLVELFNYLSIPHVNHMGDSNTFLYSFVFALPCIVLTDVGKLVCTSVVVVRTSALISPTVYNKEQKSFVNNTRFPMSQ